MQRSEAEPARGNGTPGAHCAACGAPDLDEHLRVAGAPGDHGLIPSTDRFGTALSHIVRCRRCGHMQLDRMPTEAELAAAYAVAESRDYVVEEPGQRRTAAGILEAIERFARRGAIVDLGCWVGFLLAEASERGWRGVGVEPSEFASAYARERLGLDVRTANLLEVDLPAHAFDAVVLADVIEHLADPGAALGRVAELLAAGGVVALALPDAGSRVARLLGRRWWSVIPTHVHYFTRRSLQTLLARHGFETLSVTTAPKAFTVRYYAGRLGGYSPPLARWVAAGAERVGVADRLWTPDLRDRMLVIARRPADGV